MPSQPSLTRRGVLGAAGLAAVAAGCDSTAEPKGAARSTPPAPADPDTGLAESVLRDLGRMKARVADTMAAFPGLRPVLAPVDALHRAHVEALAGIGAKPGGLSGPAPPPVPKRRAVALRQLAVAERSTRDMLSHAALVAQSGAFARLLASMSAAVDQRLAEWPS